METNGMAPPFQQNVYKYECKQGTDIFKFACDIRTVKEIIPERCMAKLEVSIRFFS